MALLLPGTLLILIAGATADRVGLQNKPSRRFFSCDIPLSLSVSIVFGYAKFWVEIVYALFMGCFSASDPCERRLALICGRWGCSENSDAGDIVSIWFSDTRLFFGWFCRPARG